MYTYLVASENKKSKFYTLNRKMQELRKSKSKKVTNLDPKHSRKSIKSDNLHVPLTPSTFRKIKTSASRPSTAARSARSLHNDPRKSFKKGEPAGGLVRLSHSRPSEVPSNLAVHFASFYQNQNLLEPLPHSVEEKAVVHRKAEKTSRKFPKMEFTRQMVYKLENSAGTQHYGKQVSAVLEDTVESPGFDLKLPPLDNCAPSNKFNDYYPLWYRDPNKIPQISREQFEEIKSKYNRRSIVDGDEKLGGKGIQKFEAEGEESIAGDSSETEVEFETETDSEEDDTRSSYRRKIFSRSRLQVTNPAGYLSAKSSKLTTSTENNKLENSMADNGNAESIPACSLDRCGSWSSQNSSKTAESDNNEEDAESCSIDWETEVEEEECTVEVKVVNNFQKITVRNQV